MSKDDSNSQARKFANAEPDYWTSSQLSEPVRKLVNAEAKIVMELGLNERLRQDLSEASRSYIDATQSARNALQPEQRKKARKRLKKVEAAVSNLRKFFTEYPKAAELRASIKETEDRWYGFAAANGWKLSEGVKEAFANLDKHSSPKSVYVDGIDVFLDPNRQDNCAINVTELCEKLDALGAFLNRQKGKDGRPPAEAWKALMRSLARIYEHATGNKPTVTENEHRAEVGERYSGQFIHVATLLDQAIAGYCNTKAHPNSALGPALRRLLNSPQTRRSKTR